MGSARKLLHDYGVVRKQSEAYKQNHKLFLCIIGPYFNSNATLVEAVLKYFGNVQA